MKCRDVMQPLTGHVRADDPVSVVINFLLDTQIVNIHVVDNDGIYQGVVDHRRLMSKLLPGSIDMMRGRQTARYLREDREEVEERVETLRHIPVRQITTMFLKTVGPDDTLSRALMYMREGQDLVPVIDGDGCLLGVVTAYSVFHALQEPALEPQD